MLNKTEIEKRIMEQLANIGSKQELLIAFDWFSSDEPLVRIAKKLENRRFEGPVRFVLNGKDRIEGIIAIMNAVKANRGIKEITIGFSFDHLSSASMTAFMELLKENHNINSVTLSFYDLQFGLIEPTKDFLELLYSVLEKNPSIKELCLGGFRNIDLYAEKLYGFKNLESIDFLSNCTYSNCNTFFSNLKLAKHLTTRKIGHIAERGNGVLISALNTINDLKPKKFNFTLPIRLDTPTTNKKVEQSEMIKSYDLLFKTLRANNNLRSLSLTGAYVEDKNTVYFYTRQQNAIVDYIKPKKSYMEELFDFLKKTKTLETLKLSGIKFMPTVQNVTAFADALSSNRSLTTLSLSLVGWYEHNNQQESSKYTNNLIDAIFSNPNLKSLTIYNLNPHDESWLPSCKENIKCLIKHLVSGHRLTELYLYGFRKGDQIASLFAELLEKNTSLESLDLSNCNFYRGSAALFLNALRKNKHSNLKYFDILHRYSPHMRIPDFTLESTDQVVMDINAELVKIEKRKQKEIIDILLEGMNCQHSPLKALAGKAGPFRLICDFLFEKDRPEFNPKETKETKELKEKREHKNEMEKLSPVSQSTEIKKVREELSSKNALILKEETEQVQTPQSNAAPISPAYLQSLSREALSTTPSVFLLLASYNNKVDIHP